MVSGITWWNSEIGFSDRDDDGEFTGVEMVSIKRVVVDDIIGISPITGKLLLLTEMNMYLKY